MTCPVCVAFFYINGYNGWVAVEVFVFIATETRRVCYRHWPVNKQDSHSTEYGWQSQRPAGLSWSFSLGCWSDCFITQQYYAAVMISRITCHARPVVLRWRGAMPPLARQHTYLWFCAFAYFRKVDKFVASIERLKTKKSFSFRGLAPDSLTRGFFPGPQWGLRRRPRYRLAFPLPNP